MMAVPLLHRLFGIRDEVQEHLLQLVRIGHGVRQRFIVFTPHVNAAHPELVAAQLQRVVEDLVNRRRDLFGFVLARKRQQVLNDAAGPPRFAVDRFRRGPLVGGKPLFGEQQLGERRNAGERVIELVRDARDQLSDRRHLF